jgi:hypothetical protein
MSGSIGDNVFRASGVIAAAAAGRTGTVDWITTPKVTGDSPVTGVTAKGYFLNTTAGTITINLPAGAAGSIVSMADYAATWQTNNVTVAANGSEKIGGVAEDATLSTEGQSVTFVYVDSTQGWVNTMDSTSNVRGVPPFIEATGGTITCSGNDKIHTFTGPGTFTVCRIATCCAAVNNLVSYIVIAGGGAGGNARGATNGYAGGGGAGGYRELVSPGSPYTGSPTEGYPTAGNRITVTATGYPITVGSGGADVCNATGGVGANSVFSCITSAGGGGGFYSGGTKDGGSGGGAGNGSPPGAGNTPPTTPAQGTNGGDESPNSGAGGGGATVAGTNGTPGGPAGPGGAGATSSITASPVVRAGGGGAGGNCGETGGGTGGPGGGGAGGDWPANPGINGTVNTGAGGGATSAAHPGGAVTAGLGGSGLVIIRYKYQ